jgi:hypothetical protein
MATHTKSHYLLPMYYWFVITDKLWVLSISFFKYHFLITIIPLNECLRECSSLYNNLSLREIYVEWLDCNFSNDYLNSHHYQNETNISKRQKFSAKYCFILAAGDWLSVTNCQSFYTLMLNKHLRYWNNELYLNYLPFGLSIFSFHLIENQ